MTTCVTLTLEAPAATATAILAREMVVLEQAAKQAQLALRFGQADRLWRQRDDIRHQRSLLMRQNWRFVPVTP